MNQLSCYETPLPHTFSLHYVWQRLKHYLNYIVLRTDYRIDYLSSIRQNVRNLGSSIHAAIARHFAFFNFLIWASLMSLLSTKRASEMHNFNLGIYDENIRLKSILCFFWTPLGKYQQILIANEHHYGYH